MIKPICFLLLIFSFSAKAQQSVEIYDLLNIMIPDSAMLKESVDWKTTETIRSGIKWNKGRVARNPGGKTFYKNGVAHTYFNNQAAPCGAPGACTWKAGLEGSGNGYTKIQFSTLQPGETTYPISIKQVLGRRNYNARLISKCSTGRTFIYEVKIPGKKPFWLRLYEINSGTDQGIFIEAWLDKTNMPVNCL